MVEISLHLLSELNYLSKNVWAFMLASTMRDWLYYRTEGKQQTPAT